MADKFGMLYPAAFKDSDVIEVPHREATTPADIGHSLRICIGRYIVDDLSIYVSAMYDCATLAEESIRGKYMTPLLLNTAIP